MVTIDTDEPPEDEPEQPPEIDPEWRRDYDSAKRATARAQPPSPLRPLGNGTTGPHITAAMYDQLVGTLPPPPTVTDLGRVDLTHILEGNQAARPFHMRRDDDQGILYPHAIHAFTGEPAVGKTWFGYIANAAVLDAGGNISVLDYESSPGVFVERMRALDICDDILADPQRVAYYNVPGRLDARRACELVTEIDHQTATLVTIDAMLPALARQGLDDNSNRDVATYVEMICRPLAATGAATLIIDHVTKDPTTRARGARGAGSKLQLVDVSYSLRLVKPFSKTRAGIVKLICEKDRFGTYAIGETVAEIHITPEGSDRKTIDIKAPASGEESFRPTVLMERVSRVLETDDGLTLNLIKGAVQGDNKTIALAVETLVAEGFVLRERSGQAYLHHLVRPFENPDRGAEVNRGEPR